MAFVALSPKELLIGALCVLVLLTFFSTTIISSLYALDIRMATTTTSKITKKVLGRPNIPLKKLNIIPHSLSVSGLSSGGFMAVQFQFAYSSSIVGAGIFAGGPYYCAQGQMANAFDQCMYAALPIDLNALQQVLQDYESSGKVDRLSNIKSHKIFLFSGTSDNTVNTAVMKTLYQQYQQFGVPSSNINVTFNVPAGHAWITNDYGNDCSVTQSPWINNCNLRGALRVLQTIYSNNITDSTQAVDRNLFTYDQSGSFSGTDMDEKGYIYIPTACQQNTACKIHVAFHGCEQGVSYVQEQFVQYTGLNAIAEKNNIIVVYPQVTSGGFENINGCWDWWSYSGPEYANKRGSQMSAVANVVKALGGDIVV
ncbi:hypothetical protein FDP41_011195 [Naegleria fowleri]|uniref:Poly(3-hydroxybutyrate) depolymerase n=1 Tax=Naegleria fowleri TaxID=5763 RepID=A0A6A5CA62_NAEFO|nr:uncharacterized protein FDP41_011195 [Naegleria fowleri]KAF0982265.1 hypothetical protein FDP41_011195 [Naegleria fowleri]CAG4711863.1 unnamed protein product [Naegleria fowleri]